MIINTFNRLLSMFKNRKSYKALKIEISTKDKSTVIFQKESSTNSKLGINLTKQIV